MALHPPSHYRAIVQAAKGGREDVEDLVKEARTVADPSFAAEALFYLSGDPRMASAPAASVVDEAFKRLDKGEREWRRAEVLADWVVRGPKWRLGDAAAESVRNHIQRSIAERAIRLERGNVRSQALQAIAKWRPDDLAGKLLEAAILNGPTAAADAKALLRAGPAPGVREALEACRDVGLRVRLLGYLHQHGGGPLLREAVAAAEGLPTKDSLEALRAVIASLEAAADFAAMHDLLPRDPEIRARLLAALAARADKSGDLETAQAWFNEGLTVAHGIPDLAVRSGVLANLDAGMSRLGGKPAAPKPRAGPGQAEGVAAGGHAGPRHVLALCDTYEGGLGDTHLRAVARAAPLCWAFGLDLFLLGFPTKDLDRLVRQASKETAIGDGGRHVADLAGEDRIHLIECADKALPDWSKLGLPVATTPSPEPSKATDLTRALDDARASGARRIVLVMGLGKHGLPPFWLKSIDHHLEITGRRVSLETATAMGILAERLRQVGPV